MEESKTYISLLDAIKNIPVSEFKDIETNQSETETNQSEIETNQSETETNQSETETNQSETETNQSETETNQSEIETNQSETETNQSETETNQSETETNQSETETNQSETETNQPETSSINSLINQIYKQIELIYYYLNILLLTGEFRSVDLGILSSNIEDKRNKLAELNIENTTIFKKINSTFLNLTDNVCEISYLRDILKYKREDVSLLYRLHSISEDNLSKELVYLKNIFRISLNVLMSDFLIISHLTNQIVDDFLLTPYYRLETLSSEKYPLFIKILKEKIKYNLFRVSKVLGKKKFVISKRWEWSTLDVGNSKSLNLSFLKELPAHFNFLFNEESSSYDSKINQYEEILRNTNFKNTHALIWCSLYYKTHKNEDKLTEIFNQIKNNQQNQNNKEQINTVFVLNCLLSCMIRKYEDAKRLDKDSEKKINKFFKLIKKIDDRRGKNYKNYFSYLKYSRFKILRAQYLEKEHSFFQAKSELSQATTLLEESHKIFLNDKNREYFEISEYENIIKIDDTDIPHIYCYNVFAIPFQQEEKEKAIDRLEKRMLKQEIAMVYREYEYKTNTQIDHNKTDTMVIIGIFAGIITYSFWTIQIFSIIENMWDAILFAWIFLSWISLLIGAIYLRSFVKNEHRMHHKGVILLGLSFLIFILSVGWKRFYSSDIIHTNRMSKLSKELWQTIQRAERINKDLTDKCKEYDITKGSIWNNLALPIEKYFYWF